jgi:hypothetical protein
MVKYYMVRLQWRDGKGNFRGYDNILEVGQKNMSGQHKKEKKEILNTLDTLDKKAESCPLESNEWDYKQYLNNRLAELLREEEIKWYQRVKVKELLEGGSNTKYFQLIANGKHRKTRIFQLQHDERVIEGEEALSEYVTNFYKELFAAPSGSSCTLDETRVVDINQVTVEENNLLIHPFTEEEVRDAIFQMEHNKAPGPRMVSLLSSTKLVGI